ncbi:hypothetical protein ACIQRK_28090 [Streptomyces anulatus]
MRTGRWRTGGRADGRLTLLRITTVGLLAVVLLGAAIGAVLPNPREALALIKLPGRGPAGK